MACIASVVCVGVDRWAPLLLLLLLLFPAITEFDASGKKVMRFVDLGADVDTHLKACLSLAFLHLPSHISSLPPDMVIPFFGRRSLDESGSARGREGSQTGETVQPAFRETGAVVDLVRVRPFFPVVVHRGGEGEGRKLTPFSIAGNVEDPGTRRRCWTLAICTKRSNRNSRRWKRTRTSTADGRP